MKLVPCIGCGGSFPDSDGPTHRYMESSPACWAAYGEVLARQYNDPAYREVYRMAVDSYAVQHPGRPSPQSVNSVGVHSVRLCLFIEHGLEPRAANDAMLAISPLKGKFSWLTPPESMGPITVADVQNARSPVEHQLIVRDWAASAWLAWSGHHEVIRSWVPPSWRTSAK